VIVAREPRPWHLPAPARHLMYIGVGIPLGAVLRWLEVPLLSIPTLVAVLACAAVTVAAQLWWEHRRQKDHERRLADHAAFVDHLTRRAAVDEHHRAYWTTW
jgi:hypothetical protein